MMYELLFKEVMDKTKLYCIRKYGFRSDIEDIIQEGYVGIIITSKKLNNSFSLEEQKIYLIDSAKGYILNYLNNGYKTLNGEIIKSIRKKIKEGLSYEEIKNSTKRTNVDFNSLYNISDLLIIDISEYDIVDQDCDFIERTIENDYIDSIFIKLRKYFANKSDCDFYISYLKLKMEENQNIIRVLMHKYTLSRGGVYYKIKKASEMIMKNCKKEELFCY